MTRPAPPDIALIAALGRNRVIGRQGGLPWHLPGDLAWFRTRTMGRPLIIGRRTWDSLNRRVLPGRRMIVVGRPGGIGPPAGTGEIRTAATAAAALDIALGMIEHEGAEPEIMIGGGAMLYASLLDRADRLYLTEVEDAPPGDAYFPDVDFSAWQETQRQRHAPAAGRPGYSFVTYHRRERPASSPAPSSGRINACSE